MNRLTSWIKTIVGHKTTLPGKEANTPTNPYASPESRADCARDAIERYRAWARLSRALGGNDKQMPTPIEVVAITNSIYPGIDLAADEAQASIDQARARLAGTRFTLHQDVVTPDGPGIVIRVGEETVTVTLGKPEMRDYPVNFVRPREGFDAR